MADLPAAPVVPAAPPRRPWWQRFTERKFVMPAVILALLCIGVATGAIPFGIPVVMLAASCVLAFVGSETWMDSTRTKLAALHIPEVPGFKDDIARMARDAMVAILSEARDGRGPLGALRAGIRDFESVNGPITASVTDADMRDKMPTGKHTLPPTV